MDRTNQKQAEPFAVERREYERLIDMGLGGEEAKSAIRRHGVVRVRRARKYAQRHAAHSPAAMLRDMLVRSQHGGPRHRPATPGTPGTPGTAGTPGTPAPKGGAS